MRLRCRKREMVRAIDLREKRKAAGLTAEALADVLAKADAKYVSALETGRCALTLATAGRAAYRLGYVTADIEGVGPVWIIPAVLGQQPVAATSFRPGEVAWIVLEEWREALEHIETLQAAIARRDWDAVSHIYEQVVCDPQHAIALLAAAIDRVNPEPGRAAYRRFEGKIAAKVHPEATATKMTLAQAEDVA